MTQRSSALTVRGPLIKTTVFIVVTLAVLALIGLELGAGNSMRDRQEYSARFNDVSGLQDGDSVRIAGVKVGTVGDVHLDHDARVIVDFTVDKQRALPQDIRLVVRYLNLTGDRFLELKQGSGSAVPLKPGSVVPVERTQPAMDLDVLLAGFQPLFEGLAPEQVNSLSTELVSVLQDQGGTIESLLARATTLTSTLADRDAAIGRVVDNLNGVLGTLDQHSPQVSQTIDRLQRLVSGLSGDRHRLGASIESSTELVGGIDTLLTKTRQPLREAVPEINRLSSLINDGQSEVDTALRNLPGAYLRISRLGSRGSTYNLYICSLRVKVTGPNGHPIYTPWMGPSDNMERCQPKVAPLETPEQRIAREGR